jgi:hypothetical protein
VSGLSVRRVLSAVRRHDRAPPPATQALLDLLRSAAANLEAG